MDLKEKSFEILNALDKPILIVDRGYHIVAANRAACSAFCTTLDSIVGQACFKLTHKADVPCWKSETICPVRFAFEHREKAKAIHEHNYAGKTVIEEVTAIPLFDTQGDVSFIIEELNDVTELVQSKEIIEHLKREVKTLRGIIPICSACKNIRDDKGYCQQVEAYIRDRSEAEFTHSICPESLGKLYPELDDR